VANKLHRYDDDAIQEAGRGLRSGAEPAAVARTDWQQGHAVEDRENAARKKDRREWGGEKSEDV